MSKTKRIGELPPILSVVAETPSLSETIWTTMVDLEGEAGTTSIVFTATGPGVGTSLVTASCALGIAMNTGHRTILVESNLHRPRLASYFGIDRAPGLSEFLSGSASLEEIQRPVSACPGLSVVPAGAPREVIPGEFVTEKTSSALSSLTEGCRFVFIDAPPVSQHSETRALLHHAQHAVLVLGARESKKAEVRRARALIESSGVGLLGTVLNHFKSDLPFDHGD